MKKKQTKKVVENRKEFELTTEQEETLKNRLVETQKNLNKAGSNSWTDPDYGFHVQQVANKFWQELGDEMGFQWLTVQPVPCKPRTFFSAVLK